MALGYLPNAAIMTALDGETGGLFVPFADRHRTVTYCANHALNACNWLVDAGADALCRACKLNRTIPDITSPENLQRWMRIEIAKHRLVYSLMRLGLPVDSKIEEPNSGIAFDFLAPVPGEETQAKILTGHDHGDITLNVIEADDVVRAGIREKMGEPYRTLLGHFRHEIAHYYFERVVENTDNYPLFKSVFGDETADYNQALKTYYANGTPDHWRPAYKRLCERSPP